MKERHLFICNTPFQVMMTLSFKMKLLQNEKVEVIISDIISDSEKLFENIRKSKVFDKVYFYKEYELNYGKNSKQKLRQIRNVINRKKIVSNLINIEGNIDAFYATDTLATTEWLYDLLISRNPGMKMYYYEEGPIAVMCDQGNHFREKDFYGGIKSKIFDRLFSVKHINGNYSGAYVSVKECLANKYFEWFDIPVISTSEIKSYVDILNQFWDYNVNYEFKNKIVYLEESFYVDGRENKDIDIVNDIMQYFGKERVCIKLHPRTRNNRYSDLGLKTYEKTSVPWELIALNGGLEGSILVCMGSGAILYPKLYWNIDQCAISLLECQEYHFRYLENDYYKLFLKICKEKKMAQIPKNKNEIVNMIEAHKQGRSEGE